MGLTPGWHDDSETVAEAREHPEVLAGKGIGEIADYCTPTHNSRDIIGPRMARFSQGWSMQGGFKNIYDSIQAFSQTDFTEDLKEFDVPTLVMHGEDDLVVPIKDSAKKSARLIKGAKEIHYSGKPHGLTATHQDEVNADLLEFLRSVQKARKAASILAARRWRRG